MDRNSSMAAVILIAGGLLAGPGALAQRHEVGLTLGALTGFSRSSPGGSVDLGACAAFQANYGFRFLAPKKAALFAEVHFIASPLREITSPNTTATRDVATLYVAPGIRVKFRTASRFSPYVAAGGGYALYEQSLNQLDGRPNPAPRFTHRGAFAFGGGADFRLWRFISGRWEVRDFYTGNPSFNTPVSGGGQHNLVASGGLVLHLGGGEK